MISNVVALELIMAPRPYWKGYLKLSLVSCPVALYPATSEREKIRFNQINKKTGHRIRHLKIDEETGDEVETDDIIKGYEVAKGQYIELDPEELEAIAIESKRVIDIDEFVLRDEIDDLYFNNPYYVIPDGEVGRQAFAVVREAITRKGMVAIGTVMFTTREHIIALEARGKGLLGVTLRYPYEIRKEAEYFDEIPDEKVPKDMLELASHIVDTKTARFEPEKFQDHYENALIELLKKKQAGKKVERVAGREAPKVINLMDALRRSAKSEKKTAVRPKRGRKRIAGQTEMLLPIPGRKSRQAASKKTSRPSARKKTG
jgi:DNA end-binding protein Ku